MQNLEDIIFSEQLVTEGVKYHNKTPGGFDDLCNWVEECTSNIGRALISK